MTLVQHILGDTDTLTRYKRRQLKELFALLRFFVVPNQCQSMTLEKEFSDPDSTPLLGPCQDGCCYCRGEHKTLVGCIRRTELIETLQLVFRNGPMAWKSIYSVLNDSDNKKMIWTVAKSM